VIINGFIGVEKNKTISETKVTSHASWCVGWRAILDAKAQTYMLDVIESDLKLKMHFQ